jgi:hypothetical protein
MAPLRVLAVLAICTAAAIVGATTTPAGSLDNVTYMHAGHKSIGELDPQPGGGWVIYCDAYDGAYITPGRSSKIDVYTALGSHWGYARRERDGRWAIYVLLPQQRNLGTAIRRTSKRWDVRRRRGYFGYTQGPDGPAAAAALLIVCTS